MGGETMNLGEVLQVIVIPLLLLLWQEVRSLRADSGLVRERLAAVEAKVGIGLKSPGGDS